jgi:hypothetical protein
MPEINRFFGVIIRMYYDEHNPPHFHAIYGKQEIQVTLDPIGILHGRLPNRATSMGIEWAALHQRELLANWEQMRKDQPPDKIQPLESGANHVS